MFAQALGIGVLLAIARHSRTDPLSAQ
jgi:hypothetical protein